MFSNALLFDERLKVDPRHDGRHSLDPLKPYDRESIPYLVHFPEEGVALFTYTYVNGKSEAGAAIAIFGAGVGNQPIQSKLPDRAVSRDMNFSDWRLEDFSMRQDLKFGKAEVFWESSEVVIDLSFDGFHPPYAYSTNKDGCPACCASDRIEQSGLMTGTIKLGNRTIKVDTTGHRDHSWGSRDWHAFLNYRWFQGQAGPGVSVHFWHFHALGETKLYGYVFKDGVQAEITDIDFTWKRDNNFDHKSMRAVLTDEAGRSTEVVADFYAHYSLLPVPEFTLREGAARCQIDGKDGLGWMEVAWQTDYRNHISSNPLYRLSA